MMISGFGISNGYSWDVYRDSIISAGTPSVRGSVMQSEADENEAGMSQPRSHEPDICQIVRDHTNTCPN